MKHKRYSRSGVRTMRGWTVQFLGLGLLAFVLVCYHLQTHRTILQSCSMVLTYLLGTGLIISPLFNQKRLIKSLLVAAAIVIAVAALAFIATHISDHKSLTQPFIHKQVIN